MRLEGLRQDDPSQLIETPKQERVLPAVLAPEEVDRFLATIDPSTPRGLRDRALFELIYSCGLRISEAADLSFDRLYLSERVIRVIGKGRKERLVPFGEEAALWLERYIEEGRPALVKGRTDRVFLNQAGKGISRKGIWKRFDGLRSASGVAAKVHTFRHSFATHLLAGAPTCGPCRSSWGIPTSRRRRSTRTSTRRASRIITGTTFRASEAEWALDGVG